MTKPSLIEALNVTIKSQNSCDKPLVVRQQDVWERSFPGITSLTACLSAKPIFNFINKKILIANNYVEAGISAETIP